MEDHASGAERRPPTGISRWVVVLAFSAGLILGGMGVSILRPDDGTTRITRNATVQAVTSSGDGVAVTWDDGTTGGLSIAPGFSEGLELLTGGAQVQLTYLSVEDHGTMLLQVSPAT